ncbi:MAG: hypothetical protein STSR0001_10160 [Methanothrix sp.]
MAPTLSHENHLRAENSKLRNHLSKVIAEVYYWRERAIFLEAERDCYRDQFRGD